MKSVNRFTHLQENSELKEKVSLLAAALAGGVEGKVKKAITDIQLLHVLLKW